MLADFPFLISLELLDHRIRPIYEAPTIHSERRFLVLWAVIARNKPRGVVRSSRARVADKSGCDVPFHGSKCFAWRYCKPELHPAPAVFLAPVERSLLLRRDPSNIDESAGEQLTLQIIVDSVPFKFDRGGIPVVGSVHVWEPQVIYGHTRTGGRPPEPIWCPWFALRQQPLNEARMVPPERGYKTSGLVSPIKLYNTPRPEKHVNAFHERKGKIHIESARLWRCAWISEEFSPPPPSNQRRPITVGPLKVAKEQRFVICEHNSPL